MASSNGFENHHGCPSNLRSELDKDLFAVGSSADKEAFKRIYLEMGPKLKAYLVKTGQSQSEADEILQETLIKVWRKASLFNPAKSSANTWIYSVAKNARIDRIRKETRPKPDPEDPSFVPDPPETGEDSVNRIQDERLIRAAMQVLSSDQAQIIKMSFFEDKSHAEISAELDLPLGTVKSRIRLAFGKIRNEVEKLS
ncbi:sigma-70 family RNA polymerase sigma factor [Sneathiella glossodoripedis]|uniref:sigma-70 family RNA polymerase sigma factor n=1 Tax=Sneathiella glossodoripedis TaxID=418853 RepID=UPI000686DE8A|nr:sigma-70 family RNA polymerase sigma factor [Sneathiella glossodoripedis]